MIFPTDIGPRTVAAPGRTGPVPTHGEPTTTGEMLGEAPDRPADS